MDEEDVTRVFIKSLEEDKGVKNVVMQLIRGYSTKVHSLKRKERGESQLIGGGKGKKGEKKAWMASLTILKINY